MTNSSNQISFVRKLSSVLWCLSFLVLCGSLNQLNGLQEPAVAAAQAQAAAAADPNLTKQILKIFSNQNVNRFLLLNPGSKISNEELIDFIEDEIDVLLKTNPLPAHLFQSSFRGAMGHPDISKLYKKCFLKLKESGKIENDEYDRFIDDTKLLDSFFLKYSQNAASYLLMQYIPLTSSQREKIASDKSVFKQHVGIAIDQIMMLSHSPISQTLTVINSPQFKNHLNASQTDLFAHLTALAADKDVVGLQLSISSSAVARNGSKQDNLKTFTEKYFQSQVASWADEYQLSEIDQKRLSVAARLSVKQAIDFYRNEENFKSLPLMEREMIRQLPSTHIYSGWKTWKKMIEKVSQNLKMKNPDQRTPLDDLEDYNQLCAQLNLDFIIMILSIYGPEMGGDVESSGLTGAQILTIQDHFVPIVLKQKNRVSFPDFNVVSNLVVKEVDQFKQFLSPQQMSVIKAMGVDLKRDMDREENEVQVKEAVAEPVPAD